MDVVFIEATQVVFTFLVVLDQMYGCGTQDMVVVCPSY